MGSDSLFRWTLLLIVVTTAALISTIGHAIALRKPNWRRQQRINHENLVGFMVSLGLLILALAITGDALARQFCTLYARVTIFGWVLVALACAEVLVFWSYHMLTSGKWRRLARLIGWQPPDKETRELP